MKALGGVRRLLSVAIMMAVALGAAEASAQRTSVRGGQFRDQQIVDETLNRQGRMEVGANLAGALSFGSVSVEGSDERASQTSLYIAPSLVAGYMVLDNIEARLQVGALLLKTKTDGESTQDSLVFPVTVQGLYQKDFILGLAGYAGIGLGGFYGGRKEDTGPGTNRSFTQSGGIGQVLLGLLAMPGPRLLLRGGLRVDAFFGKESPDFEEPSGGKVPDRSFFNTQVVFEVGIGFRFR